MTFMKFTCTLVDRKSDDLGVQSEEVPVPIWVDLDQIESFNASMNDNNVLEGTRIGMKSGEGFLVSIEPEKLAEIMEAHQNRLKEFTRTN